MSDDKMWAMVAIVGICGACTFMIDSCRGEHAKEIEELRKQGAAEEISAGLNRQCIAAGGDLIQGNCIRRAK